MTWKDRAACREADPRQFSVEDPMSLFALATIQEYCDHCPVLAECHAWVRAEGFYCGIAAGLVWTPKQRPRRPSPHLDADTPVDQMRAAHTRYTRGERDEATIVLARAYWREKRRASQAKKRELENREEDTA